MMKCRLCLSPLSAESSVSIFDSPERHLLKQQIWSCCQLNVEKDDRLPNMICILCKYKLESFTTFRNVCIQSDETLKSIEIFTIKSEEVILDDDSPVKDEFDDDSPMDTCDSATNYDFNGCDSKINIELIKNENTNHLTQVQKENMSLSSIEMSSKRDEETQCKSHCKCYVVKEKSYQCNDCLRLFITKSGISNHIKTHNMKFQPHALKSTAGMKFSTNRRGNINLTYLGFQYNKYRENGLTGAITWRCTQNKATRCNVLMKTYENSIVSEPSEHNHDACSYKYKDNVVTDAQNTNEAIGNGTIDLIEKYDRYQCNDCLRTFNTKTSLRSHIKSHILKLKLQTVASTAGMEFSTNQKGNAVLTYLGFQYNKYRENKLTEVIVWRCTQGKMFRCRVFVKTYGNFVVRQPTAHTHDACPQKARANIAMSKMRESVRRSENVYQTIGNEMMGLNDDIVAHLPKRESIIRGLLKHKQRQTSKT
ncbi:uncharacterized protein LOC143919099 [Arctopsyche grandis]|uniref:uncharacterized protein LOC143919099 n=1 Tax=Arctopsyche grandis TaxID=121162 RepID=UPI00406D7CA7